MWHISTVCSDESNSDGEDKGKPKVIETDNTNLSFAEKKKLLWEEKASTPKRDCWLVKKIYGGQTLARRPREKDGLGKQN